MNINYIQVGSLQTNCYVVCDEKNALCAIIDPGAEAERIVAAVEETGCVPQMILLTHGHYDHVGAVHEVQAQFACRLGAPKAELAFLNDPVRSLHEANTLARFVPFKPDVLYAEGDTIEVGALTFTVLETPGHTPGSCCLRCENILFSGDTLFAGSAGRTDLPGGSAASMRASLAKLAAIRENLHVLPGHGGFSTLDDERARNPYLAGRDDA